MTLWTSWIGVTVVELGDICTGFTKARQKSILGDDEYGGRISRSVSQMEHDEQNGMDPARIGRYIAGIVEKKNPAVVYVAGAQYKFLSLLCKLLPAAARGRFVGKIYGLYKLRQHRIIPALRLKHRSGGSGTASALPKCSIIHKVLSALWLSSCRTSLAVSALRIMRYCPEFRRGCLPTGKAPRRLFLMGEGLRVG